MDCTRCNLRYNTTIRQPIINPCGHSFCGACSNQIQFCPVCQVMVDKTKYIVNYSLVSICQATKDIDKYIKVCFVGESKVGKTSLIRRLIGQDYKQNTVTTIGLDFSYQDRTIDTYIVRFQLWDSAGQQRYRSISPLHYKNSDVVVIVYDVTQDCKYNNVSGWYEEATKHCPEKVLKILVGNKTDMLDEMNKIYLINPLDKVIWNSVAAQKINNNQVSCKTYEGIQQFWAVIEQTFRIIMKRTIITEVPSLKKSFGQTRSLRKMKQMNKKDRECAC